MKKKFILAASALSLCLSAAVVSCDDDKENKKDFSIDLSDSEKETVYGGIVNNFVDAVVLPTYKNLVDKNTELLKNVNALYLDPSDAAFEAAAAAWLEARQPWETSEAFLFGPVADLGLDPNMDSWPLDQEAIEQILTSDGTFSELDWTGDYEEEDEDNPENSTQHAKDIAAAQSVRGYHTLEYLLFKDGVPRKVADIESKYKANWYRYAVVVAEKLKADSESLYKAWNESYGEENVAFATTFKNHSGSYKSVEDCISEICEGCADIANEVGTSKIGDPVDKYEAGQTEEALYAVESWYSWHSRDDYKNNIISIKNSFYGSLNGSVAANSIAAIVKENNEEFFNKVDEAIKAAYDAIDAIPQPFRNNINSQEAKTAQEKCAELEELLTSGSQNLKSYLTD